ncbi:NapC/NirT family cytochrome c [Bacillus sp. FJAT-29814]|uniref:cytochrome c3 family protein n=1 Tax=Bacillus sp. FJAT-29814 TaxID=1729688 RepID=UPI00082CA12B|nr:NapC/NirT family cytochrome c [Bacillus sp. FJAT-29814]
MEEEHNELLAPPKFRYKLFKIGTLTVLFLALFFALGGLGLKATSSSEFCSSCHEIKPEYYTWKVSTHSEVECISCHVEPGAKNLAKAKVEGVVELYKKTTDTYTAPIQMPKDIPNSACESCHNMKTRDVTASGDLIIPHDKHMDKDIKCTQCHSGVAHGKIAERKVTFKSDYGKWDEQLGKSMMSDKKFTSPKMDTCMECHRARQVTTECKACHTSEMYPKTHKKEDFKLETHGNLAEKEITKCNECHQYMSDGDITLFNDKPAYTKFLNNEKIETKKVSHQDYAKENTYCQKCHLQRPASHNKGFISNHGIEANKNEQTCLTCHDYQKTGKNKTSNVTCSSCHPSSHDGKEWRETHPIKLPQNVQVSKTCYQCHNEKKCSSCHKEE